MSRILVIDDDEDLRTYLKNILSASGFAVEVAADGNEGIIKLEEFNPDLLITDIIMPNKEGLELLNELKKGRSELKIIAISGGYELSDLYLEMADKLGADLTIKKPFADKYIILNAVEQLLHK